VTRIDHEDPLYAIRATLQAIDARVQRDTFPEAGLADLKSALDDARLRVWAALSAGRGPNGEALLFRFRVRRAVEICTNVLRELEGDTLGAHQRELLELRSAAQQLAERISAVVRGGA
jgi:hypothetical protein